MGLAFLAFFGWLALGAFAVAALAVVIVLLDRRRVARMRVAGGVVIQLPALRRRRVDLVRRPLASPQKGTRAGRERTGGAAPVARLRGGR